MNLSPQLKRGATSRRAFAGYTLGEVMIAMAISAVTFAGVIKCYTQCTRRAQWSGYSLSAQAMAIKELEQARAAVWDWSINKNEITNLNLTAWTYTAGVGKGYSVSTLDLPVNGTNNAVWATNYVTVRLVNLNNTTNPLVQVQMVQVDTVWPLKLGTTLRWYTNSVANYFAPDNRDGSSL